MKESQIGTFESLGKLRDEIDSRIEALGAAYAEEHKDDEDGCTKEKGVSEVLKTPRGMDLYNQSCAGFKRSRKGVYSADRKG